MFVCGAIANAISIIQMLGGLSSSCLRSLLWSPSCSAKPQSRPNLRAAVAGCSFNDRQPFTQQISFSIRRLQIVLISSANRDRLLRRYVRNNRCRIRPRHQSKTLGRPQPTSIRRVHYHLIVADRQVVPTQQSSSRIEVRGWEVISGRRLGIPSITPSSPI